MDIKHVNAKKCFGVFKKKMLSNDDSKELLMSGRIHLSITPSGDNYCIFHIILSLYLSKGIFFLPAR